MIVLEVYSVDGRRMLEHHADGYYETRHDAAIAAWLSLHDSEVGCIMLDSVSVIDMPRATQ